MSCTIYILSNLELVHRSWSDTVIVSGHVERRPASSKGSNPCRELPRAKIADWLLSAFCFLFALFGGRGGAVSKGSFWMDEELARV